jgi:phosphopentomutase
MIDRVILIVMDSVGVGELPDASLYGDTGSNTLGNIATSIKNFKLKNLQEIGLGNIHSGLGLEKAASPKGCYGKSEELSPGKDTTTGHWEMAGITLEQAFPTFPKGFPQEVIDEFEKTLLAMRLLQEQRL